YFEERRFPKPSDWEPTHEHFPRSKREGGHRLVDNALLAHRLCNRIAFSIEDGRPHAKDLATIEKAREEAIRRKSERPKVRFPREATLFIAPLSGEGG